MTNEIKNVPELRFPEFKEEWVEKKLGEITSKISDGIHSTPTYDSNGDIYFINGNNLVNGRIDFKTSKKISVQEFNKYKNYLEAKNTLLLSINGTIGNIAKYEGENILLGKSAAYINVVSKFISRCYIFYYLQTSKIYESFLRELTGTTIKNLSLKSIKNIIVYISELDEQQKIGNFFSKLDRQIEMEEQKLSLLEEQKKGYMQQIFSQKLRFKDENGKDYPVWEIKKLGELYKVVMGQSPKSINYTDDNSYPVLVQGNADIYNGNIFPRMYTKEITKLVKKGDILLTVRAPVGEIGIAQFEACMGRGVCSIEGNKFIYYFLEMFGIQNKWQKLSQGSTFESISGNEVRNIEIPIPSPSEREKISDFFSELDYLINMHSQKIDNMKLRKQGFLQKMFV